MVHLLPARLHRAILPLAHRVRHKWRGITKAHISGVSIILTDLSGYVLLLRHSYGPDIWALPGGGLKRAEDPAECARREVREELGIDLAAVSPIGTIDEVLSGAPHTAHLFHAVCDKRPRPDRREVMEARFFPTHSLPEPIGPVTRRRIDAWRARGLPPQSQQA